MKFIYYKSKEGIFISSDQKGYYGESVFPYKQLRINGEELKNTFHNGWKFVESKSIDKVEEWVNSKNEKIGYKLVDISLKSDLIPEYLNLEDVNENIDDDGCIVWGNHSKIQSLYVPNYKEIVGFWKEIEFEAECIGELEISNPNKIKDRSYKVYRTGCEHDGEKVFKISDVARWSELEKIFNPEFSLHDRPCSISSKQTYDIIRHYVKENIDLKQAEITSDYDFCFTVKKKIRVKPYVIKWEIKKSNGKSYKPSRFNSRNVEYKSVEIFEMTSDVKKYGKYTVIQGFKGNDLQDLIDNVKNYLDELMHYINTPVKECEHCIGTGHIIGGSFEINKR